MGFFSFLCAKTGRSIPAYPHANRPRVDSEVVLVTPSDEIYRGVYDGYGNICTGDDTSDVYDIIANQRELTVFR